MSTAERIVDAAEALLQRACSELESTVGCIGLAELYAPDGPRPAPKKQAEARAASCALDPGLCARDDP